MIVIIVCVHLYKKWKTKSAAQDSGEKSGQWLEVAEPVWDVVSLMPPTAQRAVEGTRLLEQGMEVCVFVRGWERRLQLYPLVSPKGRAVNTFEGPASASGCRVRCEQQCGCGSCCLPSPHLSLRLCWLDQGAVLGTVG